VTGWLQVESAGHAFLNHLQNLPTHHHGPAPGFSVGVGSNNKVDGPVALTARG
jgi:hypothetical protein